MELEQGLKEIDEAVWEKDEWGVLNLYTHNPLDPIGDPAHSFLILRPEYCDRGHIQFNCDARGMNLDAYDSFPRYFFSFAEADAHVRTFLKWRVWKHRTHPHTLG